MCHLKLLTCHAVTVPRYKGENRLRGTMPTQRVLVQEEAHQWPGPLPSACHYLSTGLIAPVENLGLVIQ